MLNLIGSNHLQKFNRGPLTPPETWMSNIQPVMCIYKLCRIQSPLVEGNSSFF